MPPPSPIDACGQPGLPPYIGPGPAPFAASPTAILIFFLFAGAAAVLAALPWALYAGFKQSNWIPLLIIMSGFLCSLLEPMLDTLGHLQWASNLPVAFTNFGIDIPLLIPPCYAAFLGLESYFCYYLFTKGIRVKQTFWAFAIGGITDGGLAYFAAVPEPVHNWTFARMFFYRMMTRSARDKLDAKMAVRPTKDLASTSAG